MRRTISRVALGLAAVAMGLGLASCTAALTINRASTLAAAYADDLYGVHDRAALAEAERLEAEAEAAALAEREKRIAAMVAASNADADIDDILGDLDEVIINAGVVVADNNSPTYNDLYVDDYRSAYARRLQGFSSMSYRMPSSYYDYRYGDAYFLTLAYDPAFYTVMIMGDQVWVEPRYITNMFGSWNNPYYYGYHYGYNPYYFGYSYGYYDYWGWNSPYWGCDPYYHYYYGHNHWYGPHHNHYPGHHHPHHKPGGPGDRKPNVVHRPGYGTSAGGSASGGGSSVRPLGGQRPTYNERLGGRDNSRGATQIATGSGSRGGASVTRPGSSSVRPGTTVVNGRPTGTPSGSNDRGSGTRNENNSSAGRNNGGSLTGSVVGNRGDNNTFDIGHDLKGSLTGTTLRPNTSTQRGGGISGSSNSSSRGSKATSGSNSSSSKKSSGLKVQSNYKKSSSSTSSKRSSSSSSSSVRGSSSSSRNNSSTSSRSSNSGSSSSFRSSSSSSSSFGGGSSSRSSGSSSRSSSSRSGR